jgi:hypothetical protein
MHGNLNYSSKKKEFEAKSVVPRSSERGHIPKD